MNIVKSLILDIIVLVAFTIIPTVALMRNYYWLFIFATVSTVLFILINRKELVKAFAGNNKELFQLFYPFKFMEGQSVKVKKTAGNYRILRGWDKERVYGKKARISKRMIVTVNGKLVECYRLKFNRTSFKSYEIDIYGLEHECLWLPKEISLLSIRERWE